MTPPKKIEIRKGIIVGGQNVIAEIHNTEDMTYFSEEAIREAAIDMLNTSWADSNFDKAIEFMIEQLKGGNNG